MNSILSKFCFDGNPISCEKYGHGHINHTYLVVTDTGRRYILQRLSQVVFKDPADLMSNVAAVTSFLSGKYDDPRRSLHLVPTIGGESWHVDDDGEYWRVYDFVEGSTCLQLPRSPEDFRNSAAAFGDFQASLAGFPVEDLCETIPNFHNTPKRYEQFKASIERNAAGRVDEVKEEIAFILDREEAASHLQSRLENGILPLRVTHNDTKLNNVLFDEVTGEALCIIDLDTVMPGLVAYDFGDSIRFGASTGAEDEKDLSKVSMDIELFRVYCDGFIPACPSLSPEEIRSLPYGAKIITLENALRFLMDYLDGDVYYQIARPEHNLDRARTQCKLVYDMESKFDEMKAICEAYI